MPLAFTQEDFLVCCSIEWDAAGGSTQEHPTCRGVCSVFPVLCIVVLNGVQQEAVGPPKNTHHVREWSPRELLAMFRGFRMFPVFVTDVCSGVDLCAGVYDPEGLRPKYVSQILVAQNNIVGRLTVLVADLMGVSDARPWPKMSSSSCSFREKIGQIIGWRPLWSGHPLLWEILDPALPSDAHLFVPNVTILNLAVLALTFLHNANVLTLTSTFRLINVT